MGEIDVTCIIYINNNRSKVIAITNKAVPISFFEDSLNPIAEFNICDHKTII